MKTIKVLRFSGSPTVFSEHHHASIKISKKMLYMSHSPCYITFMARGESGRIVIEIEPEAKKRLYDALEQSGSTLKGWFIKNAKDFCRETTEPSLFANIAHTKEISISPKNPRKANNGKQ
jgi:hypothetical protein